MATAQQTLDIARNEIGYKESPAGSNKQKYVPRAEPWCVDFINGCCARVGLDLPGSPTSSVYTLRNTSSTPVGCTTPLPGDVGFWAYGAGHPEFVESVPLDGRSVVDIGGDTSAGDGSPNNGGEVARKRRSLSFECLGFGRPVYANTPEPPVPSPQEDDMSDRCIEYDSGAKTRVDAAGNIFNAGTPYYGSLDELPAEKRAGVTSIEMLTKADPRDPAAGYKMWAENGTGTCSTQRCGSRSDTDDRHDPGVAEPSQEGWTRPPDPRSVYRTSASLGRPNRTLAPVFDPAVIILRTTSTRCVHGVQCSSSWRSYWPFRSYSALNSSTTSCVKRPPILQLDPCSSWFRVAACMASTRLHSAISALSP
jgi:hypothetical protein